MVAHLPHVAKGGEAAPVAMAQGEPEYNQGAYPDRSVRDFFQHTLAKSYWDDDEELEKISAFDGVHGPGSHDAGGPQTQGDYARDH